MIKIGAQHLDNEGIRNCLNSVKQAILDGCSEEDKATLKLFLKNRNISVEELISHLVFDELEELKSNPDYHIDNYCKVVNWYETKNINDKSSRESTIQKLETILESDIDFKNNFFSNYKIYTEEENESKNNFIIYITTIFSTFNNIQAKLKDEILNYRRFVSPKRVTLLKEMKVELCPYCNNDTLMTDIDDSISEADIEHFLPKSKFPLFSVSFGNFIPSCKPCNSTHKNIQIKEILNPRIEGFDEDASFIVKYDDLDDIYERIDEIDAEGLNIAFEIKNKNNQKSSLIKNSIEVFRLEKQYNISPIKIEVKELFIDSRDRNNMFYEEMARELVQEVDYASYMFKKIMKFEKEDLGTIDFVNRRNIKLKFDLVNRYIKKLG